MMVFDVESTHDALCVIPFFLPTIRFKTWGKGYLWILHYAITPCFPLSCSSSLFYLYYKGKGVAQAKTGAGCCTYIIFSTFRQSVRLQCLRKDRAILKYLYVARRRRAMDTFIYMNKLMSWVTSFFP